VAWMRAGKNAELFVAGTRHRCSIGLAKRLAGARDIDGADVAGIGAEDLTVLAGLLDAGHLRLLAQR